MFDSIRRLDAKSLNAYEKDESTLADLWETATIDDVHDVSNQILA